MAALFDFLDIDINYINEPEIQSILQENWSNWDVRVTSFASFREAVQIEIAELLSNNNLNMRPMLNINHLSRSRYRDLKCTSDTLCTICQQYIHGNSYVRQLKCNHIFHLKCIDKWLLSCDSRCPNCNVRVKNA